LKKDLVFENLQTKSAQLFPNTSLTLVGRANILDKQTLETIEIEINSRVNSSGLINFDAKYKENDLGYISMWHVRENGFKNSEFGTENVSYTLPIQQKYGADAKADRIFIQMIHSKQGFLIRNT
jgi:hypothetical protein